MESPENAQVSKALMEQMLDEIEKYSIDIEEDPTQINLGIPYLQRVLAQCRAYTNRTQYYMQKVKRYENRLRSEIKVLQLDLEFKMREKLADDVLVRKQPSIEDRKALAATMLSEEHHKLAELQVLFQDVEENYKIIKAKHVELQRTSNDIKTQRNLVKDDMLARMGGGEGYMRPQTGQDRAVPEGLPPPVQERIHPVDILLGAGQPEDMPQADPAKAEAVRNFLEGKPPSNRPPVQKSEVDLMIEEAQAELPAEPTVEVWKEKTGDDCGSCGMPQFTTPHGPCCENGHGGAPPAERKDAGGVSYEDLLS